ncbi:UbiA family prenyltransferase [Shimia sp. R9_2]|uniref:UbiA family prenyltransferase n=1 Tax=Shimia sp. R9_2 TaxID=2821112 RepID=UPI001ADD230B|nr:UbiA family prenyltransferase [Shimia sp. R9_2]MBO9398604.1 UbiA family prenyltransferase [Shimia sp. R9_2]
MTTIGAQRGSADALEFDMSDTVDIPLVVDLDGTLTKSDTMHEALLLLIAKQPAKLPQIVSWLFAGKAQFKDKLAAEMVVDADSVPLREDVLAQISAAKESGRQVLLVSASNHRQVSLIGDQLELFDEAIGSDAQRNLAGSAKAQWLVDRFGERGFDYIGDSSADLEVWPKARKAITIGAKPAVRARVDAMDVEVTHLDRNSDESATRKARHYLKAMRPHQWLKNLLVFVPALAAHEMSMLLPSFFAFCAFSLAASSIYLINDMLDLHVDRQHPRKCKRPFAAGTIPVAHGVVHSAGLFLTAMVIAAFLPSAFALVLVGYVALTFAYSLVLKRKLMIDIWTLGALYTIRIVAGGAASGIPLSEWLLAFSMFVFLALAAVKRISELKDLEARDLDSTDGRGYSVGDLPVVLGAMLASGYCSVVILALYVSNSNVASLYSEPKLLWLVCMMLLYWINRVAIISYRGEMDDDPIVFALKDKVSLIVFAACGAVFLASAQL